MAGHDIIVLSREHPVSALLNHTYRCLDKTDYATNVAVDDDHRSTHPPTHAACP